MSREDVGQLVVNVLVWLAAGVLSLVFLIVLGLVVMAMYGNAML